MNKPYEINETEKDAVKKYSQTAVKVSFSYIKNILDAEDITQEVFLALMQNKIIFESEEHLKAWLIRVAINKYKNHIKSSWYKSINLNEKILDNLTDYSSANTSLVELIEEELFHKYNTDIFMGKIESIKNIKIEINNSVFYYAVAKIKISKVYLGNETIGETVSLLLLCPINTNVSVGDSETISATSLEEVEQYITKMIKCK